MKNILLMILAFVLALELGACGRPDIDKTAVYTQKQVTTYDGDDTKRSQLTCMFREDMPNVPYVDMEQYIDLVYCEDSDYTLTGEGDLYTVVGLNLNTGQTGSKLTVDIEGDTLTYKKYSEFVVGKENAYEVDYIKTSSVQDGKEPVVVYDLSQYDIDLYAEDGHVYIPLSTWADILGMSMTYPDYIDGDIYLVREGLSDDNSTPYVFEKENSYYDTITREADVAAYAYNELCFILENIYGRPEQVRSKDFINRLTVCGLDATLEEGGTMDGIDLELMKDYLTSTNKAEYGRGLIMLDSLLYDGGHTMLSYDFVVAIMNYEKGEQTEFAREYQRLFGNDQAAIDAYNSAVDPIVKKITLRRQLSELRTDSFGEPIKSWEDDAGDVNASLYIFDRTAVFQFDTLVDDVIITKAGSKPFNEALEFAKANNCESFVIDLSTNGGGSDQTMGFILSMICDGDVCSCHSDSNSGARWKDKYETDRNLDGIIDEKDEEIKYDFRYAIMISGYTYSCSNTLVCLAHEFGIPLLGAPSGGGCCLIIDPGKSGESGFFEMSSTIHMTDSKYGSIDGGIAPDVEMITTADDGSITATLYDPDELITAVDRYYECLQ